MGDSTRPATTGFSRPHQDGISINKTWIAALFASSKAALSSSKLYHQQRNLSTLWKNRRRRRRSCGQVVGITLSHPREKKIAITWQFEIRDFDLRSHPFAPDSIHLLRSSGIVLERTRRLGIPSTWLAGLLVDAGLVGCRSRATWVAFQGRYDFAILFKSLLQLTKPPWAAKDSVKLPVTLDVFMAWARCLFGSKLYDLKCLTKSCRLHGGLEKVAMQVKAERAAGAKHQAGSDSRLACEVFLKIKETFRER
ncbi:hypothetical protein KSP40_PGU000296 [Platanthera guangdongensis]|uniref:Uncharacterized protein n=1 Tax=Platanthera guangdongensis TaxID=2320717 RepID=A0ABR2LW96_9ASPA